MTTISNQTCVSTNRRRFMKQASLWPLESMQVSPNQDYLMVSNSLSIQPWKPRRTRFVRFWKINGWQLKVYAILALEEQSDQLDSVLEAVETSLNEMGFWPAVTTPPYGFVTVHLGEEAVWLLVDLWVNDILRHFLFRASLEQPTDFSPGPADGTTACVWELEVIQHEQQEWIRHVLSKPDNPDFDAYCASKLTVRI